MKAWPGLKRWVPLISSVVMVASFVVRQYGNTSLANLLDAITGLAFDPEAAAAAGLAGGAVLKFLAMYRAAKAGAYLEARPAAAKEAAVQEALATPPIALEPPPAAAKPADVEAVKDVLRAKE